jgi:rRNA processing protein Gar1
LKGNKILVEIEKEVSLNEKIYDANGKLLGIIKDIIGQVSSPLAVVLLQVPIDQVVQNAAVFRRRGKR